jgi:hypothetical protein
MRKQSDLEANGYKYVKFLRDSRTHVLLNVHTHEHEAWFANKNHASYSLKYKNTDLEFASSLPEFES